VTERRVVIGIGNAYRGDDAAGLAPLPAGVFRSSTHAFGVGDAVELARALGRLPRRVVVYGVEGAGFESGAPLSPAVAAAVDDVVSRLEEELCTNGR
jgi:hydrogenase maturation protease